MNRTAPPVSPSTVRPAVWGLLAVMALTAGVLVYRAVAPNNPSTVQMPQWVDRVKAGVAEAAQAGRVTVVELGSTACVGCREMKPVLKALQAQHGPRVQVVDIDILKETAYIGLYQVKLMPTQLFYDAKGNLLGRHQGVIDVAGLGQLLGLDSGDSNGR